MCGNVPDESLLHAYRDKMTLAALTGCSSDSSTGISLTISSDSSLQLEAHRNSLL